MSKSIEERLRESFKYGGNSEFLETLYEEYLIDPENIKPEWKNYFDSIQNGKNDVSHKSITKQFRNYKVSKIPQVNSKSSKSSDVQNLINAYRRRGHEVAKIDPLNLRKAKEVPDLNLNFHDLNEADLEESFSISNFLSSKTMKLSEIISSISKSYTSSLGYEFMHIMSSKTRAWFIDKIEGKDTPYNFSNPEKEHILKRVVDSESLEKFLAAKYFDPQDMPSGSSLWTNDTYVNESDFNLYGGLMSKYRSWRYFSFNRLAMQMGNRIPPIMQFNSNQMTR